MDTLTILLIEKHTETTIHMGTCVHADDRLHPDDKVTHSVRHYNISIVP